MDLTPIEPPADTLYATAHALAVSLAADTDGGVNLGLVVVADPPLGTMRLAVTPQILGGLARQLDDLMTLTPEAVDRIAHQITPNTKETDTDE